MKDFRFNRMEFAGAFGDLGTLVPIFISLVSINGLNPSIVLLLVGLLYIVSGIYYKIPIPVQPLKAAAAIAIASHLSVSVISAAGILMGVVLLLLAFSRLAGFLAKLFSRDVIKGIQLGVGLMLLKTSWGLFTKPITINNQMFSLLKENMISLNMLVISGGIIIMLIFLWKRSFPAPIGILAFGVIISIIIGQANILQLPYLSKQGFSFSLPLFSDFFKAFFLLVIPQLPLTLGNSVVATKDTALKYFGEKAEKVTENSLCISIGLSNIISGLLGGMPVCHGSGGLTAHYTFGARTGGAGIIIGSLFIFLSFAFGNGSSEIFKIIPYPLLGVMLSYIGIKHAILIKDLKDKKELILAFGIGIIAVITGNLTVAFVLGILASFIIKRLFVVNIGANT